MTIDWAEWLNLAIRWLHLTAGIAWIGSSFYFIWLDNHLVAPADGEASGELWSVHGGGFYHKEKYQVAPSNMPQDLHWFKWEAYWTWISGFSLLVLVYYVGASSFLMDPAKPLLSVPGAIAVGIGALVAGWLVYDGLCRSAFARDDRLLGAIWFACLVGAAAALDRVFASRAAYLHIGAMSGTVMVGNVFFVIIPNQRKVVADLVADRQPDPALGMAAKQRSLHNNYMTLPVLFIMLSHHYPMTYGAQRPWLVLALLGATGVAVRHVFNLRHSARNTIPTIALAVVLALASVSYVSLEKGISPPPPSDTAAMRWADVQPLFVKHCVACHSPHPANPAFAAPPLGVMLDSYEHARTFAPRIRRVAVDAQIMPLGNTTGMTPAERAKLGQWIAAGTPK
ncbi:MAG: urate hydroxylase PuuD [Pseudomonadota bacterium]|nr:urate hydroxylase PuuD [Pseudomonadota bacterium]